MSVSLRSADAPRVCPTAAAAASFGSADALLTDAGSITFNELDAQVGKVADTLAEHGVSKGAVVGLLAENEPDAVFAILALIRLGATCVPLSTRLPRPSLTPTLKSVGSRLVLYGAGTVLEAGGIALDGIASRSLDSIASASLSQDGNADFDIDPMRPCLAVFTSGSSATPKAAALTFSNLYFSALGSNRNIPLAPDDRWLLSLPLYHVGGLGILFRCLLGGAAVVLPNRDGGLVDAIAKMGVTHVSLVPTQMLRLLNSGVSLDHIKAILAGGSAIPSDLTEGLTRAGAKVHVSYGLTEMASQVSTSAAAEHPVDPGRSGRVLPFRSVRIAADGEVLVRGETLFAGYFVNGHLTPATTADGWFRTGDVGRFTKSGQLIVAGRRDNMFVCGGENIQPEEIEQILRGLDEIEHSVVIDKPDLEFGARPVAFVEFAGRALTIDELRDRLSPLLPRFKHPVAIYAFPEETAGELSKPNRQLLRSLVQPGAVRD